MKWIPLVLPAFAAACATKYNYCHCYNADKLPNDNATRSICDEKQGLMTLNTREYPDAKPGYYECTQQEGTNQNYWDNCEWRTLCQQKGATGSDSSCYFDVW